MVNGAVGMYLGTALGVSHCVGVMSTMQPGDMHDARHCPHARSDAEYDKLKARLVAAESAFEKTTGKKLPHRASMAVVRGSQLRLHAVKAPEGGSSGMQTKGVPIHAVVLHEAVASWTKRFCHMACLGDCACTLEPERL